MRRIGRLTPRRRGLLALATSAWVLALVAAGQDMAELEVDHALTLEVQTPHTDWAQPYAGGTTNVLFIVNGRGTLPRECVELMQRFDMYAEAVFWTRIVDSREEHWHGDDVGERRMLRLLEQRWDCMVLLQHDVRKTMSPEQQVKFLRPVVDGAGIVLVGTQDERVLKPENRLEKVPPFLSRGGAVQAYRVGEGRGVHLPERPEIAYDEGWETEYDYWAERLGRAILWAAGKEPQPSVDLTVGEAALQWGRWDSQLTVTAKASEGRPYTLIARVRRGIGPLHEMPAREIRAGESVTFRLPTLAAGAWHADVWLKDGDEVVTWNSLPFEVQADRRVTAIDLDRSWSEIGDSLSGTVTVQGRPVPGETLHLRLLDRRRRIIARKVFSIDDQPILFRFPVQSWYPMLVTVDARIMAAGQEVHGAHRYANVTKRHRGRFNFLIWDTPSGSLAPYAEKSLADHGMTLQLGRGNPQRHVAAYDVAWVPYTTRIMAELNSNGIMKPFCWNDKDAVTKHVRSKAAAHLPSRRHGAFVWSLGDEVDTRGACTSEHCARAYREYLKEQYESLAALNNSWGTHVDSWQQVGIADPSDPDETAALKRANYARWFDRQAFKSWNFVQFCGAYRKAFTAVDPEAKVGFEGAGRFDRGDDIDLIVRHNTFWSPYPGTADEVIRSIAPRDFPRSNWMGYTKDSDSLLAKYWRMVTLGMDSVWWWRWDCIGRFHGWLAPDLRPFPAVKDILQDTQVVRDGLGDLLLHSDMLDDGIAVLYSYPSSLIHKQVNGSTYGGYEAAHLGAHMLVRELGLQFRYVTDRMLRHNETDLTDFRVLILPRAEALSESSARAVRAFVEQGGLVIADCRVGIFDDHCKRRSNGILDDLFGVERTGFPEATQAADPQLGQLKLDGGISPTTGKARRRIGGVPWHISRTVGKGRTILLNADLSTFPKLSLPGTPEALALDLALTLADVGVLPEYSLVNDDRERERNVTIRRWKNGSTEIISLFRTGGSESTATVVLPEDMAVYDLRQRKYLGREKRFRTRIIPNRASFFALMSDRCPDAVLQLDQNTVAAGSVVKASLSVPAAEGLHAFRIRAHAGDSHLPWLDRVIVAGQKPVTFAIPIAYNDPAGTVRVSAIDVVSEKPTTRSFEVE